MLRQTHISELTFDEARDACVSHGGDLPVINDCFSFGEITDYIYSSGDI